MPHTSKSITGLAILLIAIAGLAWQTKTHATNSKRHLQDTLPTKDKETQTVITGDLDKALEQVRKAQDNLEQQLEKNGFDKMQKELLKAQAQLNAKDMHAEIAKAMKELESQKLNIEEQMKNIDMQKIQAEVQEAMQKVDLERMQKDMKRAHEAFENNIDYKKMEAEIRAAMGQAKKAMAEMKAIDMQKVQQQLERAKEQLAGNEAQIKDELENARKNLAEGFPKDFKKELEKAKEGVKKASEELQHYKEMIVEMKKEGLLKQDGSYSIKYKNGELYIDGVKQPDTITEKYKHYFRHENVQLKKSKDGTDDSKTIDL